MACHRFAACKNCSEGDDFEVIPEIAVVRDNNAPLVALQQGTANVVGATSWMWPREEYFESVDALFIDEAGQMALADVVAAGQAAHNLILIGDPQQLERPLKGSHPSRRRKIRARTFDRRAQNNPCR